MTNHKYRILRGDCLDRMRELEDGSVDAIVTDPPYGLEFMGAGWDAPWKSDDHVGNTWNSGMSEVVMADGYKRLKRPSFENTQNVRCRKCGKWKLSSNPCTCAEPDFPNIKLSNMHTFQQYMTPIFAEALRVAKPGAHLLCFGGTRTFHRMTCAIEDAGWEIRDCIMWVYGSGFPKSMDVGKAIDKALGAKREKVPATGGLTNNRNLNDDGWSKIGQSNPTMDGPIPSTDQAREWDGWGTCLKPAWEPIIVARKPLDGTVAHNVLTWGVGALNIDACRVPSDNAPKPCMGNGYRAINDKNAEQGYRPNSYSSEKSEYVPNNKGRFPANLVHDGSQMVLDLFPQSKGQQGDVTGNEPSHPADGVCYGEYNGRHTFAKRGDTGSAARFFNTFRDGEDSAERTYADKGSTSFAAKPGMRRAPADTPARFFYCAKASKKDRGEGNDHPTVKPNALMRWLVRLVCPQGGIVLDPFMGSGSTGVACMQEGMEFVGIDMDEHYCEIAEKRIGAEPDTVFAGALWASM